VAVSLGHLDRRGRAPSHNLCKQSEGHSTFEQTGAGRVPEIMEPTLDLRTFVRPVDFMIDLKKVLGVTVASLQVTPATSTRDSDDSLYRKNLEENREPDLAGADSPKLMFELGKGLTSMRRSKPELVTRERLADQDVEANPIHNYPATHYTPILLRESA
jgi:hypothetical protein